MNSIPTLAKVACELLAKGHAGVLKLAGMTNVPTGCGKHPLRYTATITTMSNRRFDATGNSPLDAVEKAICQEKVERQGWSAGDKRLLGDYPLTPISARI